MFKLFNKWKISPIKIKDATIPCRRQKTKTSRSEVKDGGARGKRSLPLKIDSNYRLII